MSQKTVLVVGGAGFIGSHVNLMLNSAGYNTIVFDNLSRGNPSAVIHGTLIKGDISNPAELDAVFKKYKIDAVMHFAAYTDVGESCEQPLKYYQNNVAGTLNLLEAMIRHHVNIFVFSSSAAVYGQPNKPLIDENHPCNPINPYGEGKWMVEKILQNCSLIKNHSIRSCSLRYFNAAGGDPDGLIKNHRTKENNLIPLILRSLKNKSSITIFGTDYPTPDGTCIRDYIHVNDLAQAHINAMEKLLTNSPSSCYNLGNGQGFSVRQVISAVERVTGMKVRAIEGDRRPGDPPILVADAHKAHQELNWIPQYPSLEIIVEHAWKAMK